MEHNNLESSLKKLVKEAIPWLENKNLVQFLSAILILIIFIYVVVANNWTDLNNYYKTASEVLQGSMPYSQSKFEYPPLSLVFMIVPCMLSWNKESFFCFYAIFACLFFFISIHYIRKIVEKYCEEKWKAGALALCLIFFGSFFIINRNDIFPATVVIIGVWMYLNKRYVLAFILVAIATMIKLYPGIFILAMILPFVINRKWKTCFKCIFSAVMVCLLVELPFLIIDPSTAFAYLSYHSERGIQIESVIGSVFLIYQMIIPSDIYIQLDHGSDTIMGIGPNIVAPWMNPTLYLALLVFVGVMFYRCRYLNKSFEDLSYLSTMIMFALLMIFLMFSKVYSAQYVIWIALMIPFTQISYFNKEQRATIFKAYVMLGIFSFLSYTTYYPLGLVCLNTVPVLLTVLKNVLFVCLFCKVLHYCWLNTSSGQNASTDYVTEIQ